MHQLRSALLDKHHHQGRHRHVYPMSTSCALSRASRVSSTLSVAQHRIAHNGRRSAQNQNSYKVTIPAIHQTKQSLHVKHAREMVRVAERLAHVWLSRWIRVVVLKKCLLQSVIANLATPKRDVRKQQCRFIRTERL
uniref:Nudix hydrolase domain-containing protein n=1 Tax=Parascaris univalens TaxID=6257 RepID=A0A914ZRN3_PARUN